MMSLESENRSLISSTRGFSLIELLVTVCLVGIMMTAVYGVYIGNVRAVKVEEERVEIQQGQRIAIDFMARELRMAGYSPLPNSAIGIVDARPNFIYFTADLNRDGDIDAGGDDANENVAFCVFNSAEGRALSYISGVDNTVGDVGSVMTDGPIPLAHTHTGHRHDVLTYVENIEFSYTLVDGTQTTAPTAAQLRDIRSISVTLLSRADDPDLRYTDTQSFTTPSGTVWAAMNDNTRRRLITANIRLRNMGLNNEE